MPRRCLLLGTIVAAALVMSCGSDEARPHDSAAGSVPTAAPNTATGTAAPTVTPTVVRRHENGDAGSPTSSFVVVPAPSLDDNLLGDPAELEVAVWLPPTYDTSGTRYPVVYFLAGYGESASVATISSVLERLIEHDQAPEMILVGVDGVNSLGGSFYVDSPVTGLWAQAIHHDLVTYIDANYRTLPQSNSRGVAGFSMGGFGAVDLAMRHPDVFGSVYALSPGLLAPGGLEATQMFADDEVVADFLAMQSGAAEHTTGTADLRFSIAYGAAFAPDPGASFPYVAYPFSSVGSTPDPEIWARWEAGYGGVADEVGEFASNLRRLRGIALDYGTNDQYEWIPDGVVHLADQLARHGITADVTAYDGGHGPVGPRAEAAMFPFFTQVLDVEIMNTRRPNGTVRSGIVDTDTVCSTTMKAGDATQHPNGQHRDSDVRRTITSTEATCASQPKRT